MVTGTIERAPAHSFERSVEPPLVGSTTFLPPVWEKVRNRAIKPSSVGKLDDTYELRREFIVGASMMGFELVDLDDESELERLANMDPPREPLQPQQLLVVDAINAGNKRVVVEMPRRAAKSTTIFCLMLGRCACRPRYKVTFSAQTGSDGRAMLEDWVKEGLDRISPPDEDEENPFRRRARPARSAAQERQLALFGEVLGPEASITPSPSSNRRPFTTRIGNSAPQIRFDNYSTFRVLKPEHSAYRGKAADVSWIDEAQEIDPQEGDALLAGILPLQDTRPGSQVIISGTAGEAKIGPFWKFLDQLRNGSQSMGGIDYAAAEDTPWELVEDEDSAMRLLQTVHPGVGTLTNIESMRENWRDIPRPQWAREYLSMWPETYGQVTIPLDQWRAAALQAKPKRPPRVAFGLAIKPRGSTAAIAAAWRTPNGTAYVEIIDHRQGTQWIPERLKELSTRYKGATFAYDEAGEGAATKTEVEKLRPMPKMVKLLLPELVAAGIQFLRDIERGKLRHADQIGLNAAVEIAGKREVRGNDRGIWLWTPAEKGGDITCLDAATRALRNWDQYQGKRTGGYRPTVGGD